MSPSKATAPKRTGTKKPRGGKKPATEEQAAASLPEDQNTEAPDVEDDHGEKEGLVGFPLNKFEIARDRHPIYHVLNLIKTNALDLNPDFQRSFVWKEDQQSLLIQSVFLGLPLPYIYLATNPDDVQAAVDGVQRLTTFLRFFDGALTLDIEEQPAIHGKKFADLPTRLQLEFTNFHLDFIIIGKNVPAAAHYEIFRRVNGGTPLTPAQLRNAVYNGPATRLVAELALCQEFLDAVDNGFNARAIRDMRDREAITRYFGFRVLGWKELLELGHNGFLAETLHVMNVTARRDPTWIEREQRIFKTSMRMNHELFASHAFRKSLFSTSATKTKTPINLALLDAYGVTAAEYADHDLTEAQIKKIGSLSRSRLPTIEGAVTRGTSKANNLEARFVTVGKIFADAIGKS